MKTTAWKSRLPAMPLEGEPSLVETSVEIGAVLAVLLSLALVAALISFG